MKQPIDPSQPPVGYSDHDIERRHLERDGDDRWRDRFQRDYDRLVHAPAFRRLQGKTQVLAPGEADFFRTRLTHSLEVAQVARRLAQKLGANRDLCEASALLHDLGHPPCAHVGEKTLNSELDIVAKSWGLDPVADVGGFNGNAQSFRLAVKALSHRSAFAGFDLTRAVLDGAVKYPWERNDEDAPDSSRDWCFYPTEHEDAGWVRENVPDGRRLTKSVEAQIVDWADDVAYSIHDVEDWYRAGFMPLELIAGSDSTRTELAGRLSKKLASEDLSQADARAEVLSFLGGPAFQNITVRYDGSTSAKKGLRAMRSFLFDEFIDNVELAEKDEPATRHNNDLSVAPHARLHSRILKRLLVEYVIGHPRMATYEVGQAHLVRNLFQALVGALDFDPASQAFAKKSTLGVFPADTQEALHAARSTPAELLRLIADHLSGMTDGYAVRLQERLSGLGSGRFNEFV